MSAAPPGQGQGSTQQKQLPREALVMQALLKEMGVTLYEPRVIHQMLDFVYRYVTNVVEDARVYSTYAKKKAIDAEDVKLAAKMINSKCFTTVPPREMLLELAKNKNSLPLPLLKNASGLRLPPDRFCLTQPNYQLEFYNKAVASSASQQGSGVKLPGTAVLFKTPQNPGPTRVLGTAGTTPTIIQYTPQSQTQQVTGVKRKLSEDDNWKS